MPDFKLTHIFSYRSGDNRSGGWTESWYYTGQQQGAEQAALGGAQARAQILPSTITISGLRVQVLGQRAKVLDVSIPGLIGAGDRIPINAQDIPQMCIYCSVLAANGINIKRFSFRGMPDGWIVAGAFTLPAGVAGGPAPVLTAYNQNGYCIQCQDTTAPFSSIASIAADGTVTTVQNFAAAVGNQVRLFRVRDVNNKRLSGVFYISAYAGPTSFKLQSWPGNIVATVGKIRLVKNIITLFNPGSFTVLHASARKVGRPFELYRGRTYRRR